MDKFEDYYRSVMTENSIDFTNPIRTSEDYVTDFLQSARTKRFQKSSQGKVDRSKSKLNHHGLISYIYDEYGEVDTKTLNWVDSLPEDLDLRWIMMWSDHYYGDLILELDRNRLPKVLVQGDYVLLEPEVFVKLIRIQEVLNKTKLKIFFDRSKSILKKKDGAIFVQVINPKRKYHGAW